MAGEKFLLQHKRHISLFSHPPSRRKADEKRPQAATKKPPSPKSAHAPQAPDQSLQESPHPGEA